MHAHRFALHRVRTLATGLTGLVTLVALTVGSVLTAGPVAARTFTPTTRVTPGNFTGYAFDRCQAPTQQEMDAWRAGSQYGAVGIYIAGDSRFCDVQENLSAQWVAEQARKGWRVLPITVGRQASCSGKKRWTKVDDDPANGYASARRQGRVEARDSVAAARAYGIAEQSTLWLDMENFDIGNTACRKSALAFVFAWTRQLHRLDYRSGFYSSASTGIRMVDDARAATPGSTGLPDQIWIGDWNGRASVHTSYISDAGWMPHARMHQYAGGHEESHGGVRLTVDSSFLDVGRGSVPRREPGHCGVPVDFGNYWSLQRGDHNHLVAAMQCFLRKAGFYHGAVNG
ncbi:MAG: glycoside hydrolase domain-containing protein, partial [Nocardioidaceae bacterium]